MSISEYLCAALDKRTLPNIIKNAIEFSRNIEFDSIAVRGMSGSIVASAIAFELEKNIIIIRKDKDNTHSDATVEYSFYPRKYIIVDDFISSGKTIKTIIEEMEEDALKCHYDNPKCIGVFLYCDPDPDESKIVLKEINEEFGLKIKLFSSFI